MDLNENVSMCSRYELQDVCQKTECSLFLRLVLQRRTSLESKYKTPKGRGHTNIRPDKHETFIWYKNASTLTSLSYILTFIDRFETTANGNVDKT